VDSKQAGNLSNWFGVLLDELTGMGDFSGRESRIGAKTHPASLGGSTTKFWSVAVSPADFFFENSGAPGFAQCCALLGEILASGGHTCVTD
jgi:hypothetical protein